MADSDKMNYLGASTSASGMQFVNERNLRWFFWFLFSFSGRLSRLPYFLSTFVIYGIAAIAYFAFLSIGNGGMLVGVNLDAPNAIAESFELIAVAVGGILLFWSGLALMVKRAHDMGWGGGTVFLLMLVNLVPIVGSIMGLLVSLVYLFGRGHVGPNKFGRIANEPNAG